MKVFIGKNIDDKTLGIVIAKTKELAVTYWQGRRIFPYYITEVNDETMQDHPTGVYSCYDSVTELQIQICREHCIFPNYTMKPQSEEIKRSDTE